MQTEQIVIMFGYYSYWIIHIFSITHTHMHTKRNDGNIQTLLLNWNRRRKDTSPCHRTSSIKRKTHTKFTINFKFIEMREQRYSYTNKSKRQTHTHPHNRLRRITFSHTNTHQHLPETTIFCCCCCIWLQNKIPRT